MKDTNEYKFKVGDKVQLSDGSHVKYFANGWHENMRSEINSIQTIERIFEDIVTQTTCYRLSNGWVWDERCMKLVSSDKTTEKVEDKHVLEVGTKVRILDGSNVNNYVCNWVDGMNKTVGEIGTVEKIDYYYHKLFVKLKEFGWSYDPRYLEVVEDNVYAKDSDYTFNFEVGDKVEIVYDPTINYAIFITDTMKLHIGGIYEIKGCNDSMGVYLSDGFWYDKRMLKLICKGTKK